MTKTISDVALRKIGELAVGRHKCEQRLADLDPGARIERRAAQHELDAAAIALADAIGAATKWAES